MSNTNITKVSDKENITIDESVDVLQSETYCILRHDLSLEEDSPQTSVGYLPKVDWTRPHRCIQPDRLEDEEFNLIVLVVAEPNCISNPLPNNGLMVRASSIDFDYVPMTDREAELTAACHQFLDAAKWAKMQDCTHNYQKLVEDFSDAGSCIVDALKYK